jgi:N-methylhydantoinase A
MPMSFPRYSLGVDIGGTFTDVVLIADRGQVKIAKGLSTPDAFDRGIAEILRALLRDEGVAPGDCTAFVHGTTVATNAIIERKGARTGLITTRGFRDVLELRRIRIPKLYDLTWQKPLPLVERYLRMEVVERMTYRGEVHTPLDEGSVVRALAELRRLEVESIAVCLLNSYANPAHERAVRDIIRREASDIEITISSDVLPEMREYERTSTSVINAYLMPVVRQYIGSLGRTLRQQGFRAPLLLMQSNGGAMTAELGCEQPMRIIESGPAAGVVASHKLAQRMGIDNAVTLDIGGTTAKASLIEGGELTYSDEYDVGGGFSRGGQLARGGGYVLRAPTLDISEIGAGGGSIVWIDGGGALQVGPKSAGAYPGPICYGRGGTEPTLTDACVVLGYLGSEGLAGGAVQLDRQAAETVLQQKIADPLRMGVVDLAFGVLRIAVSNMTRAIRSVSTERGKDPRDFNLIAFGGNGGVFSAAVARELSLRQVIIPPAAGIFSAFGLLYSNLEHHFTQTMLGKIDEIDPAVATARWRHLEDEAIRILGREGFAPERCKLQRFGALRYFGQTHELSVPWPPGNVDRSGLKEMAEKFEHSHHRTYGHRGHDSIVELVNLRLVANGVTDQPRVPDRLEFPKERDSEGQGRRVWFGPEIGYHLTTVTNRAALDIRPARGPLIVREFDTTIVVPPDFQVMRDSSFNVILSQDPPAGAAATLRSDRRAHDKSVTHAGL